jgi:hypothetical protein
MQPSPVGERYMAARGLSGPAAYITGGITLSPKVFGLNVFAIAWTNGLTNSGTYEAKVKMVAGDGSILVVFFVVATGAEVGAGVNLSAELYRVAAIGN